MATEVIMPQMGESIFEGTITKWLKKVGEQVQKDEPLFEISTDKVDAEIPSPTAGVLTEIKVQEGATVQINTVVALVGAAGEESKAAPAAVASAPAPSTPAKAAPGKKDAATADVTKSAAGDGAADSIDASAGKAAPEAAEQLDVDQVGVTAGTGGSPARGAVSGGTEVVMPQMGESIFEGTITKWLKKEGESVQKDEPLFEISTDKVDAEIPAPIAGVLSQIKVAEGTTVQINTVVAVIGGTRSGSASSGGAISVGAGAAAAAGSGVAAPVDAPDNVATNGAAASEATAGTSERLRSSPLVRRIAKDNNLDLRQIPGTGSGGRITKDDTLKYLSEKGAGSAPAADAAPTPESLAAVSPAAEVAKPLPSAAISPAPTKAPAAPVASPVSTLCRASWCRLRRCGRSLRSGWLRATRRVPMCIPCSRWI